MKKKIRVYPASVLSERTKEVEDFEGIGGLTEDMLRIMFENEGIGLAANQVGVSERVFVMKIGEEEEAIRVVNPVLMDSEGEDEMEEGCLSVPGTAIEISRPDSIKLRGFTPDGEELELKLEGLMARVALHEMDHLNGILIIDYLPRKEILRFMREYTSEEDKKEQEL